jgi:ATP-dependent Clp protease ATP-binding subunit ClpA
MVHAENFTERVKMIVQMARQEAVGLERDFVDTEHLLLGILRESGCVASKILKNLGYAYSDVLTDVRDMYSNYPKSSFKGELPFTPNANRAFELSLEAACQLGHDVIGSEHLLLAILKQDDTSIAITILKRRLKPEEIRDMIFEVIGADVAPKAPKPMIKHFVSASCGGEKCRICGLPSTHKVGEEIPHDDPFPNRHNLTAYVCYAHFMEIVGPAWTAPCREGA